MMFKALARAHRSIRMLDDGRCGSDAALAEGETLDRGDPGKILMLTLLTPEIVELTLEGQQLPGL